MPTATSFACECNTGFFWDQLPEACEDPCESEPCDSIEHAVAGTCAGVSLDDFICGCETGYSWDEITNACLGPCDPDPCGGIQDAIPYSCTDQGEGQFTCDCDAGFDWDSEKDTCEDDVCVPDPCDEIENTVPEGCTPVDEDAFQCECESGFTWDGEGLRCSSCENYRECLKDCDPNFLYFSSCVSVCIIEHDAGCECDFGLQDSDYLACRNQQCNQNIGQLPRWLCAVDCFFDGCLAAQ